MPQLEQIHTFTSQIFWLFVALGIVYFFLSRYAVPRLSKVIESRETAISSDVNAAEHFKNSAQSINAEFEKKSASVRADAFTITTEAEKRANTLYDKHMGETEAELKKHIEASEKDIILAKDKAVAELNANISAYVNEIVEKVAGIKVEKVKVEKLLKQGRKMHFDEKFFVALVTIIFFAMTFKPMKRALTAMLDSRIDAIKKNLADAEKLRNDALALLQEAESKLARTETEAKQILDHARNEAERIISDAKSKLDRDIEVRKKLALQKIQSFEDKAIEDIKKNIAVITVEVAEKAIDEAGNDNDFKKLIAGSIEKLSKTVH